jgi:VWFA-related protein
MVSPRAQTPSPPSQVFRSGTELVLVNVVVRDKSGAVVRNLSRDEFIVTEDDKLQTVTSFDFEQLEPSRADEAQSASAAQAQPASAAQPTETRAAVLKPDQGAKAATERPTLDMRGRRLIVLFFDLSSMQAEELERAVKAAHDYVEQRLSPADLIAIASFSTSLQVVQDFTADRC